MNLRPTETCSIFLRSHRMKYLWQLSSRLRAVLLYDLYIALSRKRCHSWSYEVGVRIEAHTPSHDHTRRSTRAVCSMEEKIQLAAGSERLRFCMEIWCGGGVEKLHEKVRHISIWLGHS